jgi:hypothetical protein
MNYKVQCKEAVLTILSQHLLFYVEKNHQNPQSGWPSTGSRLEPWNFRLGRTTSGHSTTALSLASSLRTWRNIMVRKRCVQREWPASDTRTDRLLSKTSLQVCSTQYYRIFLTFSIAWYSKKRNVSETISVFVLRFSSILFHPFCSHKYIYLSCCSHFWA